MTPGQMRLVARSIDDAIDQAGDKQTDEDKAVLAILLAVRDRLDSRAAMLEGE